MVALVFPKTRAGLEQAQQMDPAHEAAIWFCDDYEASDSPVHPPGCYIANPCANRRADGNRHHNRCLVCMAGYPLMTKEANTMLYGKDLESQATPRRIGL